MCAAHGSAVQYVAYTVCSYRSVPINMEEKHVSDSSDSQNNGNGSASGAQSPVNPRQAHLAFERQYPEMILVPDDLLPLINFDAIVLTDSVLAAAPRIKAKRYLFEKVQPFDMRWVDDLEDYGLALGHAQAVVRFAEESLSGADLGYLMEEHESLVSDVDALLRRKLLDPVQVSKLPRNTTHAQVGHDVLAISNFLLSRWPQLEGRCPSTKEELEHARERSNLYILATTAKGDRQTSLTEAVLNRRRAAYLVLSAYRHIRSALMLVLDSQEKVDEIAPPLGRRKKSRRNAASSEAPISGNGDDASSEAEASDDDELEAAEEETPIAVVAAPQSTAAAVRIGMPGSSPTQDGAE